MATGPITQLTDLIESEQYTSYVQELTTEKSRLIQSGALVQDPALTSFLSGEGRTITMRKIRDLDNDVENISSDEAPDEQTGLNNDAVPKKLTTAEEQAVRLSRNQAWQAANLASELVALDPMEAIARREAAYWVRRQQAVFLATMKGVLADNAAAPTGEDQHTQNDFTVDLSAANGGTFQDTLTNFSSDAYIDTLATMGDSEEELGLVFTHSIVKAKMRKLGLLVDGTDLQTGQPVQTFLGRTIVIDDGMPHANGVYETWFFGRNFMTYGEGTPAKAREVFNHALSGNGAGSEGFVSRVEWIFHPTGYAYKGLAPKGGPSNAATTGNLANEDSWTRVARERKQIKFARLITRES